MPNFCHNDLWICGEKEDVDALLALMGADKTPPEFDFNRVLPYPKEFAQRDADYPDNYRDPGYFALREAFIAKYGSDFDGFNSGGAEWCIKHWGVKWPASDVARRDYDGDVCVTFQTAWAPPLPVVEALAKYFPRLDLALEYFEKGTSLVGGVRYFSAGLLRPNTEEPRIVTSWRSKDYDGVRGG